MNASSPLLDGATSIRASVGVVVVEGVKGDTYDQQYQLQFSHLTLPGLTLNLEASALTDPVGASDLARAMALSVFSAAIWFDLSVWTCVSDVVWGGRGG
jgi:hypothetical protein